MIAGGGPGSAVPTLRGECLPGAHEHVELGAVVQLPHRPAEGLLRPLLTDGCVGVRRDQAGMGLVERAHVGHHPVGELLAGGLVGVGGERVEPVLRRVRAGVGQHVRDGLQPLRTQHPRKDEGERPVGLGHRLVGGRGELGGQVGGRGTVQDQGQLGAGLLQPLDGGGQLGVERAGGLLRVRVGVVHLGDLGQREPEVDEPLDPQQPHQVRHPVLLVAVRAPIGLGQQPDLVVVPHRPQAGAGQLGDLTGAPAVRGDHPVPLGEQARRERPGAGGDQRDPDEQQGGHGRGTPARGQQRRRGQGHEPGHHTGQVRRQRDPRVAQVRREQLGEQRPRYGVGDRQQRGGHRDAEDDQDRRARVQQPERRERRDRGRDASGDGDPPRAVALRETAAEHDDPDLDDGGDQRRSRRPPGTPTRRRPPAAAMPASRPRAPATTRARRSPASSRTAGLLDPAPQPQGDPQQRERREERQPPAPGVEALRGERRHREERAGGQQGADGGADLRHRRVAATALRRRVLDGEGDRAAPLAADRDALQQPEQGQQQRGRQTDRQVGGQQADQPGDDPDHRHRDDQAAAPADPVAEVAEDHRADRARGEPDRERRERGQRRDHRVVGGEVEPVEHQRRRGAVEEEVVPLERGADERAEGDPAGVRVGHGGRGGAVGHGRPLAARAGTGVPHSIRNPRSSVNSRTSRVAPRSLCSCTTRGPECVASGPAAAPSRVLGWSGDELRRGLHRPVRDRCHRRWRGAPRGGLRRRRRRPRVVGRTAGRVRLPRRPRRRREPVRAARDDARGAVRAARVAPGQPAPRRPLGRRLRRARRRARRAAGGAAPCGRPAAAAQHRRRELVQRGGVAVHAEPDGQLGARRAARRRDRPGRPRPRRRARRGPAGRPAPARRPGHRRTGRVRRRRLRRDPRRAGPGPRGDRDDGRPGRGDVGGAQVRRHRRGGAVPHRGHPDARTPRRAAGRRAPDRAGPRAVRPALHPGGTAAHLGLAADGGAEQPRHGRPRGAPAPGPALARRGRAGAGVGAAGRPRARHRGRGAGRYPGRPHALLGCAAAARRRGGPDRRVRGPARAEPPPDDDPRRARRDPDERRRPHGAAVRAQRRRGHPQRGRAHPRRRRRRRGRPAHRGARPARRRRARGVSGPGRLAPWTPRRPSPDPRPTPRTRPSGCGWWRASGAGSRTSSSTSCGCSTTAVTTASSRSPPRTCARPRRRRWPCCWTGSPTRPSRRPRRPGRAARAAAGPPGRRPGQPRAGRTARLPVVWSALLAEAADGPGRSRSRPARRPAVGRRRRLRPPGARRVPVRRALLAEQHRDERRQLLEVLFAAGPRPPEVLARVAAGLRVAAGDTFDVCAGLGDAAATLRGRAARLDGGPTGLFLRDAELGVVVFRPAAPDDGRVLARLTDGVACVLIPAVVGLAAVPAAASAAVAMAHLLPGDAVRPHDPHDMWPRVARAALDEHGGLPARVLAGLATAPPEETAVLRATARVWLEHGSVTRVASALYCHRNTVLNRMRRFRALTGLDLTRPRDAALCLVVLSAGRTDAGDR
ncbi:hypothetical protein L7F22_000058 [Adiantum nelumboides]|nr:hypothetical protein [Adiantum nelumboides]